MIEFGVVLAFTGGFMLFVGWANSGDDPGGWIARALRRANPESGAMYARQQARQGKWLLKWSPLAIALGAVLIVLGVIVHFA